MPRSAKRDEPLDSELSCRLTSNQKSRIQAAALLLGRRPSDFVREAALAQADQVLAAPTAQAAWDQFVGLVDVPSTVSRQTGKAFTELLLKKHAARRRPLP